MFFKRRHTFTLSPPKEPWHRPRRPYRPRRIAAELVWVAGWFVLAFGAVAAVSLASGTGPACAALLAPLRFGT